MKKEVLTTRHRAVSSRKTWTRVRDVLAGVVIAAIAANVLPRSLNGISNSNLRWPPWGNKPDPEWKDDVYPIYPPTQWDISTDFPYPRKLKYEVTEGTWLRLDVHPTSGEIVFDMMGDIYCLPSWKSTQLQIARPVLLGIPHDSDPHFSPTGDRLAFRSDAELGVENIWVIPWKGCDEMAVHGLPKGRGWYQDESLHHLGRKKYLSMQFQATDEHDLYVRGILETKYRKVRRLTREGRLEARRVTNETYRYVSDPRFHPSGNKIVATKWYTSSRSLGAGEGWEYEVPSLEELFSCDIKPISAGTGKQLIKRHLPLGWTTEQYGDQQVGPEQLLWHGEDTIIFAKNVNGEKKGVFEYSGDVHRGIYSIFSRNLTSGKDTLLVAKTPGSASRPEISRDGTTLAFVRRVRDKEALVVMNLETGTIRHLWHGLTYDLSAISAPMGTYPSYAFAPDDEAIIIWSSGQIYSVPLDRNSDGEIVPGGAPTPIPFKATIEKRIAETMRVETDLVALETAPTQKLSAFRNLDVDEKGENVVFEAAGVTYIQPIGQDSKATPVPTLDSAPVYYQPSFVPGYPDIIVHSHWSDTNFTTFEIANVTSGVAKAVNGRLPKGRYFSPTITASEGPKKLLAFVRTGGDVLSGNIVETAGQGLYVADIWITDNLAKTTIRNVRFIPSEVTTWRSSKMRFLGNSRKLLVQEADRSLIIDLDTAGDKDGRPKHEELAKGEASTELVVVPGGRTPSWIAFVDYGNVYAVEGKFVKKDQKVWSKPGKAIKNLARVGLDGGHDIQWSRDGSKLVWLLGPYLHSLPISKLSSCQKEINADPTTFGIMCTKSLLELTTIDVSFDTDISRLKREARVSASSRCQTEACLRDADTIVVTNATILTMSSGQLKGDLIEDGTMIVKGGVISEIGKSQSLKWPSAAFVVDAEGGLLLPGFIDGHAHWTGYDVEHPAKSWEMETFLAYGVTTLHNPSSDNVHGFVERGRVERGGMSGPRIFHTGGVVYGAALPSLHAEAYSLEDARSTLLRIKTEGGDASFSYKNYNQPSRAARQRLILAAKNLSMIAVPEGGMNQDWDLTYIIDGMATVEHFLPVPQLYDDVLTLFSKSGTATTPTHLVNYGGAWGEQLLWKRKALSFDSKLRRFTRHDVLETLSETSSRPKDSFQLYNTSATVKNLVDRGARALIGAHGEPPLGSNYHGEMYLFQLGGMPIYEVFKSATISAAITLGLDSSIGSLEPGKLADFVLYPSTEVLTNLSVSPAIKLVARGGRIWEADTMSQIWPTKAKRSTGPPLNPE